MFVLCAATTAAAQTAAETSQLTNRLKQLENQIQTMSRAVYRGDKEAAAALSGAAGESAAAANFEVRMSQIEDQQRKTTGEIEKISFGLQEVKDQLARLQADIDQRFAQVEQSRAAPAEPPAAPASAAGTLGTLGSSSGSNGASEALYEEAFANVREARYEEAETGFREFLKKYPGHPLSANAQYWLGETYYVRGDYTQAAKSFAQGYQDFPKSAKAADSLYKLSLSLVKLNRKDDACLSLRQFQKEFQSAAGLLPRKAQAEIKQLGCP